MRKRDEIRHMQEWGILTTSIQFHGSYGFPGVGNDLYAPVIPQLDHIHVLGVGYLEIWQTMFLEPCLDGRNGLFGFGRASRHDLHPVSHFQPNLHPFEHEWHGLPYVLESTPVFGFAERAVKIHSDPLAFLTCSELLLVGQRESFRMRYLYLGFARQGFLYCIEHVTRSQSKEMFTLEVA